MTNFKVRAYGKSELAWLYFPTANSAHTAVNHLMAWCIAFRNLLTDFRSSAIVRRQSFLHPER